MSKQETFEEAIIKLWASRGLEVTEINLKHHPGKRAYWGYRIEAREVERE